MHTGISDKAAGPPHLHGKRAEPLIRGLVETGLPRELFGIETPAFPESRRVILLTEARHAFQFLGKRDLDVMAGHGFVRRQGGQFIKRALIQRIGVDQIGPGNPLLHIAAGIAPRRVAGRNLCRDRLNAIGQARQLAEILRQQRIEAFRQPGRLFHQGLRAVGIELRIGAQERLEILKAALKADLFDDLIHGCPDTRDLALAELVNLFG